MNRWLVLFVVWMLPLGSGSFVGAVEPNLSIERMRKDIFFLASDECEGRGVETQGINKAAEHIAKAFQDAGLKPGGVDNSYFQPFTISGGVTLGTPNRLELTGPLGTIALKSGTHFLPFGMSRTGKVNAELVFVGYGVTSEEAKYDDYAGIDVAGKIVIILRKVPREGTDRKRFCSEEEYQRIAPYTQKIANALNRKAAGVLFVNDAPSAKNADVLLPFEVVSRETVPGNLPIAFIRRDVLDQLLRSSVVKSLSEIESTIDKDLKPQSVLLRGWKAELEITVNRKELAVKNVIGVLEGKGPLAKEIVVIGAHYDHLGRGEIGSLARGDKNIHYGADDNASGTTAMLELARRFAAIKEREGRTLIFMAFSGEERGLLGSRHYCEHPLHSLKDMVAMINLDMVGRLRGEVNGEKGKLEIGGIGTAKDFEKLIDTLNEKHKFEISKSKAGLGPSDHASFFLKNVPVFFFFTGLHPEYHKPTDKPDLVNLQGMLRIVQMVEELATILATRDQRPEFVKVTGSFRPGASSPGGVPKIGFMPGTYNEDEEKGVLIGGVTKDGPADKGGLKEGDFIVEIAGKPIKNMTGYMTVMASQKKGQPIELVVDRKGEKIKLKVVPE